VRGNFIKNKCGFSILGLFLVSFIMALLAVSNRAWADCSTPLSISGSKQMPTSVQGQSPSAQTLMVSGGEGPYQWTVPAGYNGLNTGSGSSVVYTAPTSNANCSSNPTLRVTDSCNKTVSMKVSMHNPALAYTPAIDYFTPFEVSCVWARCCSDPEACQGRRRWYRYRCDNSIQYSDFAAAGERGAALACGNLGCAGGQYYCEPICGTCTPVVGYYWAWFDESYIADLKANGCCPAINSQCMEITNYTASASTINLSSGGKTTFMANLSPKGGGTTTWRLTVGGKVFTGSGNSLNQTWDGTNADNKQVDPGIYMATLIAQTTAGTCGDDSDLKNVQITVNRISKVEGNSEPDTCPVGELVVKGDVTLQSRQ
jgi:hypothetical protein